MNKIRLDHLRMMALAKANSDRNCSHLESEDEQALEMAARSPTRQDYSQWGSLAPREIVGRYANGTIVAWALTAIGQYCTVRDVGSVVQTSQLMIDSYVLAQELKRFGKPGAPYTPDAKFMQTQNLVALRRRLDFVGCTYLNQVPGLDVVALVLNSRGEMAHWSLMLYFCRENSVVLFDSLGRSHFELAETAYRLFVTLRFIPSGTLFERRQAAAAAQQRGAWECGYLTIANALFFSRRLYELLPDVTDPSQLTGNDETVRRLAAALLKRSQQNRIIAQFRDLRMSRINR